MTDKSLYCVECERLARERDELRREVRLMYRVVNAAEEDLRNGCASLGLEEAIDSYEEASNE